MADVRKYRRTATALAALMLSCVLLVMAASPGRADVSDAITTLGSNNLYVDPTAGAKLDQSAANSALSGSVKIAVLPADAGNAGTLARQIGSQLGGQVTVGVFVGRNFNAGSNLLCSGQAGQLAATAVADNRAQLQQNSDLTATIKDFATLVNRAGRCSTGSGYAGGSSSGGGGGGHAGWIALGVLGVVVVGGAGGAVAWRRRKNKLALLDARATVQPYYDRLASEVGSLDAGANPVARQALADASERFTAAGAQLSGATRPAQIVAARRSVLEGLQAARSARVALGMDPGPDVPPPVETQAPQLSEQQQFTAAGQQVIGYPSYAPGAPYYFAGGGGYAGGWYSFPFWESLLIAEALSPGWGWGGGWGGAGYDSGYSSGYDSGFDAGRDAGQNSGGDWGSSNGDWGSSGGDWGSGGGDFSSGGGSDGGGSW